jgi:pSer/pThr/pTyr-binding forkhead associated (FHA) protein/ribosomal protein L40E
MTRTSSRSTGGFPQCPVCQGLVTPGKPFCPSCGTRVGSKIPDVICPKCSAPVPQAARFCATCGYGLQPGAKGRERTSAFSVPDLVDEIKLIRVDESGTDISTHAMPSTQVVVGRDDADIVFADDPYLSPRHAELTLRGGHLYLRDLGSRNGTWAFLDSPYRLHDGDLILIGSQIIKYRRLGYPGPHPPEADATRRLGSLTPSADIATLTQLRADASPRDVIHLSPGRNITVGRDQGDWLFSYDPSMSGLHAQIRSEDADFTIMDAGSRNGVAVAVRAETELHNGSRFLVGNEMLRIEMP